MTKPSRVRLSDADRFKVYDWIKDQAKTGPITQTPVALAAKASKDLKIVVTADCITRLAKSAGLTLEKPPRARGYVCKNRTRHLTQCVLRLAEALQTIDPALVSPGTMTELQALLGRRTDTPGEPESPVA